MLGSTSCTAWYVDHGESPQRSGHGLDLAEKQKQTDTWETLDDYKISMDLNTTCTMLDDSSRQW